MADKGTYGDAKGETNKKPITGTSPSSGTAIVNPSTGDQVAGGTPQESAAQSLNNPSPSDTTRRVGDWVNVGGNQWAVVPNSETDLKQRYQVIRGATPKNDLKIGDYIGAGLSAIATGLTTKAMTGGIVSGPLQGIVTGAQFLQNVQNAEKRNLDAWLNQDVEWDYALDYDYTDKDGNKHYKVNYDKMKDAGYGSGSAVKESTNTDNTDVFLNGDNQLVLKVTPAFANSERYKDLLGVISNNYSSLTRDEAFEVVDEETGDTRLDKIRQAVKAEEIQFYYNARSAQEIRKVAPNASVEAVYDATKTQLIGNLSKETLEETDVVVYTPENEKQTVNAKTYLDSIKGMDKKARNDYMLSIANRLNDPDIDDDEKAVLKGQANALYSASSNEGEYHDMYQKDFFDTVADAGGIFTGVRLGDLFGISPELSTFADHEFFAPVISGGMDLARVWAMGKISNGIEKLSRSAVSAIGSKIGGKFGETLSKYSSTSLQDKPMQFPGLGGENGTSLGDWAKTTASQFGYMAAADLAYEGIRAATYGMTGNDFDFLGELGSDVALDMIMTYGPRNYVDTMSMPKYEYRRFEVKTDPKTGEKYLDTKKYAADEISTATKEKEKINLASDDIEDEFYTTDLADLSNLGIREKAGLVEITADELAQRRAKVIDKLTDNKVGMKVQELFFDKNAAMAKLAVQVRAAGGGETLYKKLLRYAGDIKQITRDTMDQFKQFGDVNKHLESLSAKMKEVVPKSRDFSQADADYINSVVNRHRFLQENKGDKKASELIHKHYDGYIEKIDPERAAQLDELLGAMRAVVGDVLDFYQAKGLMTPEQVKELRKSAAYKGGMFFPVWAKEGIQKGGDIKQSRSKLKKVFDKSQLIAVEDLENPLVTLGSYLNNAARNVALNDRALAIREGAQFANVPMHLYSDTGGGLDEVKNLKELNAEFGERYQKIVDKVNKQIPSHQQWQKINDNLILESKALNTADKLAQLKKETTALKSKRTRLLKAQEKLGTAVDESKLLPEKEDLSDMLILDENQDKLKLKDVKTVDDAVKHTRIVDVENKGVSTDTFMKPMEALLRESYQNGTRVAQDGANAEEEIRKIVQEAYREMYDRLMSFDDLTGKKWGDKANDVVVGIISKYLSKPEIDMYIKGAEVEANGKVREAIKRRNQYIDWWNQTEDLRRNLGVESYTYGVENDPDSYKGGWIGLHEPTGGNAFARKTNPETGTRELFTPDNESKIRIAIENFNSLEEMKSTIVHEAAHAALTRSVNRVPLINDALRILGVDADVSWEIAHSRDAHELIAHMTQIKFLSDSGAVDAEKLKADTVVQAHLNSIMKNLDKKQRVNFKERFIDQIANIITFVKAKLLHISDAKTLEEFYSGLVSGQFANDLRMSAANRPVTYLGSPLVSSGYIWEKKRERREAYSYDFGFDKVDPEAQKMALQITKLDEQIKQNEAEQARLVDGIKDNARELMEDAQKVSKGSPVKIDIDSYIDVQVTNDLKTALRSNNPTGQVQAILNKLVEAANPYVSRQSIINEEAAKAARKFRKQTAKKMVIESRSKGKLSADHINALADRVADVVTHRVTGRKPRVSAIDGDELTRFLGEGGDGHTIRYMIDGEEHRMTLTGKGSEALVQEFYAPEFNIKSPWMQKVLNVAKSFGQAKRYLTTSMDPTRVLPNLARDWTRGIVTTGGDILLSPDMLRADVIESGKYTDAEIQKINNGFELASAGVEGSTFTESMQMPKKNRKKSMIRALNEPTDGNAFQKFVYDRTESTGKLMSTLQDMGETFTRRRAMENAYYKELGNATAKGMKIDDAVKSAVESAYFAGREATTNFFRRGKLISQVAQFVPYLSQKFATLESFKYAYLDDPITTMRSLKSTVSTYAALIAIALSNDESRQRYYLLTEYERANNFIIPLANDMIIKVPLDETIAAFLTPYRRMIETLNGVDPEAFYLWGAEALEALSPLDLTGFSEGDKFNVVRGFQKLGAELVPTWALPILETMTGTDWFYGSQIGIDEQYVGNRTGNYTPTPGEMTTKSNNSKILAGVSDATGIPQWILQRFYSEYGGNIGQYTLNMLDKLAGATEEAQGGKEFFNSIFKPFTGASSDSAANAFWDGTAVLEEKKAKLQNEIRTINTDIKAATGEKKAELIKKRQEKIKAYGLEVSDFLNQYLSAYEITGGLSKKQANRVWRLYDLYSEDDNQSLYLEDSVENYYADKAQTQANKKATNLAARSDLDKYYAMTEDDYDTSYGIQALKNSVYGVPLKQMVDIANILEDTSDYGNSFTKLRQDAYDARSKAYDAKNYDLADSIAYQYDFKVLAAIYPYLVKNGVAETLNRSKVMDYLSDWIMVPSSEMKTSKGKYVPNLGKDSQKEKAFKKQFVKKMFGVLGE